VREAFLARHGESTASAARILNGDPAAHCPLTAKGREQARDLGRRLAGTPIDVCVVTPFARTVETADLALAGRDVPRLVLAELGDPPAGVFEGRPYAEHKAWFEEHTSDEAPSGGESHLDSLRRFRRGYARLLQLPEASLVVVAHSFVISVAVALASGPALAARVFPTVEYATAHRLDRAALERVIAALPA
jgi:broad specificity phosphatase PhoE